MQKDEIIYNEMKKITLLKKVIMTLSFTLIIFFLFNSAALAYDYSSNTIYFWLGTSWDPAYAAQNATIKTGTPIGIGCCGSGSKSIVLTNTSTGATLKTCTSIEGISWIDSNYWGPSNWKNFEYTFSTAGTYQVTITDSSGGAKAINYIYVEWGDTTPPTVGGHDGIQYTTNVTGTVRVNLYNVTDNSSGVQKVGWYLYKNGTLLWEGQLGSNSGTTYYKDITLSGEGTYAVHGIVYDNAGNSYNWTSEHAMTIIADGTAPTHGYWVNESGTNINWTTSYTNLASGGTIRAYAMGAADALSGIEAMYVWVSNNGAESWNILTQQKMTETTINGSRAWYYDIPITIEGTYILHTCPKDNAGNWVWSGPEQYIVVDRVVPQITSFTPQNIATNQDSITVTVAAADTLSGMNYIRVYAWYGDGEAYRTYVDLTSTDGTYQTTFKFSEIVDGATNAPAGSNGVYNIHIYAYDKAGNYSTQSTIATYDTFAPTNGSVKINNDSEFTNILEVTLTLYAEDETSGVAQVAISNTETVGTYEEYVTTKTWNLGTNGGNTEEGIKTVYVVYKDAAGNTTVIL